MFCWLPRFNEAEVSLDEMDSGASAYMKEDLLKRKFIATWQELCGVVAISPEIEICTEEIASGYTKTPYPEINRRVTRLLRCNEFPDHYDIVELIERCNTKHELGISVEEKAQLSREVFKDVGKILKSQRARDFKAHFGSHLTDDALKKSEDPALLDASLLDTLKKSLKEGQEKLEQLCEGFVFKQEMESEQKSQDGDTCESEDNDGEEEDEEEEEEEGEEIDIEGEGVHVDVEGLEGEEEDEILVGAVESEKGGSEGRTCSKSYDIVSGSDDDDVDDDDEAENTGSRSSDVESDVTSPVELASKLSSPSPTDTTSLDEEAAEDCGVPPRLHAIKRQNTDDYPDTKKMRLMYAKTNGCEGGTQEEAEKEKQAISPPIHPTITTTTTTTPTVILLDDDDSDVIVLSD